MTPVSKALPSRRMVDAVLTRHMQRETDILHRMREAMREQGVMRPYDPDPDHILRCRYWFAIREKMLWAEWRAAVRREKLPSR